MITLCAGDSSLVIAPEIGGALLGWTIGSWPVLRRPDPEAIIQRRVRGLAGYPLVPFSNRIAYGRFSWSDRSYQLRRNFGDHPHTLHGVGWQSVWDVAQVSDAALQLILRHGAIGEQALHWPFPFVAELHYSLDTEGLAIRLAVENLWPEPAPAGLGLHPYFPRTAEASLRFAASGVWINGADSLPSRHEPVPPRWSHTQARRIGSADLDNLFTGWDGHASISLAPSPLRVEVEAGDAFRRLVVYTPAGRDYFCVEPVSHMTDAINRLDQGLDTGLRILAPGEVMQAAIRLRVKQ